jgi:hypothetical protein
MKKFITHPLTVTISFLIIIISGQQFGGFYLLYLLLGLPHAAIHSILGVFGVVLLLFNMLQSNKGNRNQISPFINVGAILLLWLSLFFFFYNDKSDYNMATFYQLLPQILLLLFFVTSIYFFVDNILLLIKNSNNDFYKPPASE